MSDQTKQQAIQALRGMRDFLPKDAVYWTNIEDLFKSWLADYGYQRINLPIIESTKLFLRSLGDATDIVEKEMFTFTDALNGKSVTLRPEGTASCLRAVLEHHLLYNQPTQRLWYYGSMFRHERPQKGRYREFCQMGIEALGMKGPDIDAELILMTQDLWQRLGLQDSIVLQINSIGQPEERKIYRQALISYFEKYQTLLDEDSQQRLKTNPLRILDSKNTTVQKICLQAPRLIDYLDYYSREHYDQWKNMLTALNIPFIENTNLVRGLDYYNLSVFEWVTEALGSQNAICAGGRYDGLTKELGGQPTPTAGFAIGVDRLLLLAIEKGQLSQNQTPDIYLIQKGEGAALYALCIAKQLRQAGFRVLQHAGDAKFSYQFKQANLSQARFAVIVGENEIALNNVTIKPLIDDKTQQTVKQVDMINILQFLTKEIHPDGASLR